MIAWVLTLCVTCSRSAHKVEENAAEADGNAAAGYAVDPVTRHLLVVNVRLMQNLRVVIQELMAKHGIPASAVPIPKPAHKAQELIPKMTTNDDVEAFLSTFKRTDAREDWHNWAHLVAPNSLRRLNMPTTPYPRWQLKTVTCFTPRFWPDAAFSSAALPWPSTSVATSGSESHAPRSPISCRSPTAVCSQTSYLSTKWWSGW